MFDEEDVKPKGDAHVVGCDLTSFSIEELEKRMEELKTEITRLEEAASAKRASMASAESFFKS